MGEDAGTVFAAGEHECLQFIQKFEEWMTQQRKGLAALRKLQSLQAAMALRPPLSESAIIQELQKLAPSAALDDYVADSSSGYTEALSDLGDSMKMLYSLQENLHSMAESLEEMTRTVEKEARRSLEKEDSPGGEVSRMLQRAYVLADLSAQVQSQTRIQDEVVAAARSASAEELSSYFLVWDLCPYIHQDGVDFLKASLIDNE